MAYSKAEQFNQTDIQLAKIAKAMGHPARVAIIKYLAEHNVCICNDIVEVLPLSQSTVSQHLKALKNAGLIKGEIEGPKVCYCLNNDVLAKAWNGLQKFFTNINCC